MEMGRLTRDGTAEPVSRDQTLGRERGQENINFPCSVDHEQDWQPYPVDPYSCCMYDHTYMLCVRTYEGKFEIRMTGMDGAELRGMCYFRNRT